METSNPAPLVSIITACYNDGAYINECVDSVQNSTYKNIEHIIVDDGSNRETRDILNRIEYSNVHIYYKDNEGVCLTRNYAINKAEGKYILFLDGDDKISNNYIGDAVAILEKKTDVRIVTSEVSKMFGYGDGQIKVSLPIEIGKLLSRNLFTVTTMMRREDALRVGGFDVDFNSGLEDWNFWISVLELGGEVAIIPGINFYYRIKRRHRNNKFGDEEARRVLRLIWEKHKSLYSIYYADPFDTYTYQSLKAFRDSTLLDVLIVKFKEFIKSTKLGGFIEQKLG